MPPGWPPGRSSLSASQFPDMLIAATVGWRGLMVIHYDSACELIGSVTDEPWERAHIRISLLNGVCTAAPVPDALSTG
jgi:hypothetical protein